MKEKVNYVLFFTGVILCLTIILFFVGIPIISQALGGTKFEDWY